MMCAHDTSLPPQDNFVLILTFKSTCSLAGALSAGKVETLWSLWLFYRGVDQCLPDTGAGLVLEGKLIL